MKSKRLHPGGLFVLAIIILVAGCSPIYYAPNGHNVPLFSDGGQAGISASYEIMGRSTGGNLQTAVAVSDHIGIMAGGFLVNTSYENEFDLSEEEDETCKGHLIELGAGYFETMNSTSKFDFILEAYGGMGFGKYDNTTEVPGSFDPSTSDNYYARNVSYQRYFIQPSFGLKSDYFEFAVSMRLAGLNYTKYEIEYDEPHLPLENISLLFEPAITLRAGFDFVKMQAQFGFSFNLNNQDLIQEHWYVGLGMYFNLTGSDKTAGSNDLAGIGNPAGIK
jgi:hypothetical protein